MQTSAYATPTMAAMLTQAAVMATRTRQDQASRESAAEFWRWLRWVTVALLGVGGVCWVVVAVVRAVALVRVQTLRQRAAIARDAFRVLPGHWAEWQAEEGYHVYTLPGLIEAHISASDWDINFYNTLSEPVSSCTWWTWRVLKGAIR